MTAGTSALLVLLGGGAAAVAAIARSEPRIASVAGRDSTIAAAVQPAAPVPPVVETFAGRTALGDSDAVVDSRTSDEADRTATREPRRTVKSGGRAAAAPGSDAGAAATGQPPPQAAPVVTTVTVTETRPIPYGTRLVRDPSLQRGSHVVQTPGVPGERTLRWLVTRTDGKETGRRLIDTTVTRQPQHEVVAFGAQHRGWRHRHMRECGPGLDPCLPLGRSACPDAAGREESGSITVLDKDLALMDPAGLELDPGACPVDGPA